MIKIKVKNRPIFFISLLLSVVLLATSCASGIAVTPSKTVTPTPSQTAIPGVLTPVLPSNLAITPTKPVGPTPKIPAGLNKIEHFIFIMQENHSFDNYFGTYPGADGIPPGVALLDSTDGQMVSPWHDSSDVGFDGPHEHDNALACINGGKMDGFLHEAAKLYPVSLQKFPTYQPGDNPKQVMGYLDYRDIPNYWIYADLYVLQDRMFESIHAYSLPAHLYKMAAQSGGYTGHNQAYPKEFDFPEITMLLASGKISWKYYTTTGNQTDTEGKTVGSPEEQKDKPDDYTLWNPLPAFPPVKNDPTQMSRLVDTAEFFKDAAAGQLPQVSWITPYWKSPVSEHPQFKGGSRAGMAYVTGLINAVMASPNWNSSAIFLAWDDWGGYYDHVPPPDVDEFGYGIRVPGLVISPYAKQGYIDHKTYSFESWLKIVEERFGVQSMTARDTAAFDMIDSFDFTQKPRPPVILAASKEGSPYPQPKQKIER